LFRGRSASLWRAKDGRLLRPRCARVVVTCDDTVAAATDRSAPAHEGA